MLIQATSQVEIPAQEAVIFDSWVIKQMILSERELPDPLRPGFFFRGAKKIRMAPGLFLKKKNMKPS